MAFIGNTPQTQGFTPAIDYFNGDGVTVTFTLSRPIASVAQVIVAIDNVIQNPSSSYTVAGSAITFSSAPLSGTNNIWVEYTSLITTYQAISQDPTVIGDIRATGGYLAEGDFGNSFVDGAILDYVTGNGRVTVGDLDNITFYHGGTASRAEMMKVSYAGGSYIVGNLGLGTTTNPTAVTGFATPTRTVVQASVNGYGQLRLGGVSGTMLDHDDSGNTITTLRSLYGATSASAQMQLQSGFLTFGTGTSFTERMRITSGGSLLVGTTTAGSSRAIIQNNNNASGDQNTSLTMGANTNNSSSYYLICSTVGTGADRMYILGNGNLQNINNSYGALSDVKLKENIVDASPKLDKLNQVRVVNYNLKDNPEQKLIGVIAQELEQIFPNMIEETPDRDADGNVLDTKTKAIKYSVFVPMLIKAMQEQQQIINDLKARIETLEAK